MRINYKSDFDIILHLRDCKGDVVAFPDCDFDVRFWTQNKANAYTASRKGGVFTNCFADEGGIHFVFNSHRMGIGTLQWEPHFELPNDIYPDGIRDIFSKELLDVKLVDGPGDCPTTAEIEIIAPFIKGEPFTYEDFTPEQIDELQRPATEAAGKLDDFVRTASEAESVREANEKRRVQMENQIGAAEQGRQTSEVARRTAENERIEAEADREEAETKRVSAEESRAEEFALWQNEIDSKADRSELSNVIAQEPLTPDNFPGINTYTREELKMDLFIDMWNQAWKIGNVVYGKYDPDNAPDSEHTFMGNEIWFTFDEAMKIWKMSYHHCLPVISIETGGTKRYPKYAFGGYQTFCRTYLPIMLNANYALVADNMFDGNIGVETILILDSNSPTIRLFSAIRMFSGCEKLRKIISPLIIVPLGNPKEMFNYCNSLEDVDITFTIGKHSLSFAQSAKLSLTSLNTMVSKAAWDSSDSSHSLTSTITVHPDVYAKLTDENNTEWHKVLTDAAAKNITFATT